MKWGLGIDPGHKGAIASLSPDGDCEIFDMPVLKQRVGEVTELRVNALELLDLLEQMRCRGPKCTLEFIRSFGSADVGKSEKALSLFFKDAGVIEGLLVAIDYEISLLAPTTWQAWVKSRGKGKEARIARAIELYPQHKSILMKPGARTYSDGRCDALLLAHCTLFGDLRTR